MKTIVKLILQRFEGRRFYQHFFERLQSISLKGMNIGRGDELDTSGEVEVIRYVHSRIFGEPGPIVIFDVGANVGRYSLRLLEAFEADNVVIHAFEPSSTTYVKLVESMKGNPKVRAHNIALGDTSEVATLYSNTELSGLSSMHQRELGHWNIALDRTELIQVKTLDGFCKDHGIAQIHFLKLDVEGHELSALMGAQRLIEKESIRFIQFEFGGCNIDSRTYFRDFYLLLQDRYNISRIVRDGLRSVPRYTEAHELFATTNYFAELKRR